VQVFGASFLLLRVELTLGPIGCSRMNPKVAPVLPDN
jgi:hypothetical protein